MSPRRVIALWALIYVLGNAVCILIAALLPANYDGGYCVGLAQGAFTAIMWMLAWRWQPRKADAA